MYLAYVAPLLLSCDISEFLTRVLTITPLWLPDVTTLLSYLSMCFLVSEMSMQAIALIPLEL